MTSEITVERDGDELLWRMSTAIVERDGAYSAFPGLMRISTAIEGSGTHLHDPASGMIVDIPPFTPSLLKGDIPWAGRLKDGTIRHLNLIYDASKVNASVQMLHLQGYRETTRSAALFCVSGMATTGKVTLNRFDCLLRPPSVLEGEAVLMKIYARQFR